MTNRSLMFLLLTVVVSLPFYSTVADSTRPVYVYQFQEDDQASDSFIKYLGDLEDAFANVTSFTLCARLRFFSLRDGSRFFQLTDGDDPTIQIDVDVSRLRVNVGGLRRYHLFRNNLKAHTWHHVCITVHTTITPTNTTITTITSFIDGTRQDQHVGELRTRVTGTELKVGSGDTENNFHGQLSQVNIWSRRLFDGEIKRLALCKTDIQGDVIPWSGNWRMFGKVTEFRESLHFFCKTMVDPKYYIFPEMRLRQGFSLCEGLGGSLPIPQNKTTLRVTHRALSRLIHGHNIHCNGYWYGATDEETEGTWLKMENLEPIIPFWRPSEPDGGEVQNCARGTLEGDLAIEDIPCDWKQCVLCVVPKLSVWALLGACQLHDRNRLFSVVQNAPGQLFFQGYSYQTIEKINSTWYWREHTVNEKQKHTIATLIQSSSIRQYWPIGRNLWRFEKSVCEKEPGKFRTILLSPCSSGHFTCDDATCIPLFQRCDLKPDCRDESDEHGCRLVQFPPSYRSDIPPASLASDHPLKVALHITIESADIDTSSMMMHVNYNLSMTWSDPRLAFLNLNEDRTLNRVKQLMVEQVWVPVVDFTNTRGNHYTLSDHEATMMINMQSVPTLGDDSHAEEVEVYPGTMNSLSIRRKYSKTFQCQFDLTRYPFDKQGCKMEMSMLSASSRLLQFDENATKAIYSGNTLLIEYTVGEIKLYFHNYKDFAVMFVEVGLSRRAGFILMNVYIPSMCLLVISYLSLYFKAAIFQVRMLGSLTTLLVMATLYTQASSQLPKSSYFKLVDVWLLTSILIIFAIICFHVIIDRLQDTPSIVPKHPLSAIIIKPDLGHGRLPKKKPAIRPKSRSRSSKGIRVTSPLGTLNDKMKQKSMSNHSLQEARELVTTLARLGIGKEVCSTSISLEDLNRKRRPDKSNENNRADEAKSSKTEGEPASSRERTYREFPKQKMLYNLVKMESADDDDDDNAKKRRTFVCGFWKCSCKDVDMSKTVIITARVIILGVAIVFNICYWTVALGSYSF